MFGQEEVVRTIILSGEINNETVSQVVENIIKVNEIDDLQSSLIKGYEREPIHLYLDTVGGVVYDALSLIGVIENSKTPVITICTGYAFSAGLYIMSVGHHRVAYPRATFMYHDLSQGVNGTMSNIETSMKEGLRLRKLTDEILLDNSIMDEEDLAIMKMDKDDYFFTAEEALELGLIDDIIGRIPNGEENNFSME